MANDIIDLAEEEEEEDDDDDNYQEKPEMQEEEDTAIMSSKNETSFWETAWIGKICEIYWSPSNNTTTTGTLASTCEESEGGQCHKKRTNSNKRKRRTRKKKRDDDVEDTEDEFEADWYDGTILSFHRPSTHGEKDENMGSIFQVKFLGEDKIYTMKLQKSSIRPSARAWIQNTVHILLVNFHSSSSSNPLEHWNNDIQEQLLILNDLSFFNNYDNAIEDDRDIVSSDDDERPYKHPCTNERDTHHRQVKFENNQLLTPIAENMMDKIYSDHQIQIEKDLVANGFPLDKVPPPKYLHQLEECLKLASQVCTWWDKEICVLEEKKIEFSDFSIILDQTIRHILHLVMMAVVYTGNKHTSKEDSNNATILQPWPQLLLDEELDTNHKSGKFLTKDVPHILHTLSSLSITYPYRPWIPFMASKVLLLYEKYWFTICTWIKLSNQMLGYVLKPEYQNYSLDEGWIPKQDDQEHLVKKLYYTPEDIQRHLDVSRSEQHGFRCIQLPSYQTALQEKIQHIRNVTLQLWLLIYKIIDEPTEILSTQYLRSTIDVVDNDDDRPWQRIEDVDPIMRGLCHIQAQWKSDPRLSNMSVISTMNNITNQSEILSLQTLEQVIVVRRWIIDMKLVDNRRERHGLVASVISRGSSIPHLPNVPMSLLPLDSIASNRPSIAEYISQMLGRLASLSSFMYPYGMIAANYDRLLEESRSESLDISLQSIALRSISGVRQALDTLENLPIIYPVEEYLNIRMKILEFHGYAESKLSLSGIRFSFQEISLMYQFTQALRLNKPIDFSSLNIITNKQPSLLYDNTAEMKLKNISDMDMSRFCSDINQSLKGIYEQAFSWKSVADTLVNLLKQSQTITSRTTIDQLSGRNATIHLSQIDELLTQYEDSKFIFDQEYVYLRGVRERASTWASEIDDIVCKYDGNPTHLTHLRMKENERPIGLTMDPSTETVTLWTQFLEWHQRVMELEFVSLIAETRQNLDITYLSFLRDHVEPLLWEGHEILTDAIVADKMSLFYREVPKYVCMAVPDKLRIGIFRLLSVAELKSTMSGLTLLRSLSKMDESRLSKLHILQLLLWYRAAKLFRDMKSNQNSNTQRLLSVARDLIESVSSPSNTWNIHTLASMFEIAFYVKESCYKTLSSLVETSARLEEVAKETLTECNLFQGDLYTNKKTFIDLHLKLYDLITQASSPSMLRINPEIEQQLVKRHREFRWLDNCFKYPVLFQNSTNVDAEVVSTKMDIDSADDHEFQKRVPISSLHNLYSSIVNKIDENGKPICSVNYVDKEIKRLEGLVRALVDSATNWKREVLARCSGGVIIDLCCLESLYNHEVLSKVAMPHEEDMLYFMIDVGLQIKFALNQFLTRSFINDDTALVIPAPPTHNSIVGKLGEFILFQFCNSSFHLQIKQHLFSCAPLCNKTSIVTGEKCVFRWLSDLWLWLDKLCGKFQHSAHKLTIGYDDCKESLGSLSRLLTISDVVTATLDSYSIVIALKQPSGKISVNVSHQAVICSVGYYALRWLVFFHNALLADLLATDTWNTSVQKFTALFHSSTLPQKKKEYVKKVNELFADMNEKFVVLPPTATLDSANAIFASEDPTGVEDYVCRSNVSIDDRFENDENIVSDRFCVLDNLINRKARSRKDMIFEKCWCHLYETTNVPDLCQISSNELMRLKSRSFFESSFIKALDNIGIEKSSDTWHQTLSLCSILAWELETIVYDRLVGEGNEDYERQVNEDYKAKVLSLRFNLEDKKNPLLCARVLLGILSLSSLVDMTPEQLACKEMQNTRAKIEEESKKMCTINPLASAEGLLQPKDLISLSSAIAHDSKFESRPSSSNPQNVAFSPDKALKIEETSLSIVNPSLKTLKETDAGINFETKTASLPIPAEGKLDASVNQTINYPSQDDYNKTLFIIDSTSSKKGDLLADDSDEEDVEDDTGSNLPVSSGRSGNLVMSLSGTRDYLFTIKAMKLSFSAGLFWDKSSSVPFPSVSNLLPHEIVDKGRVPIDEFNNFITAKMKSDKWDMVALKLVNIHDEDEIHFKNFYKEYESIRRIAMFRVSDLHLYLVTPKFLDVAHCLREIIVNKKPSTYAVLLIKRSV